MAQLRERIVYVVDTVTMEAVAQRYSSMLDSLALHVRSGVTDSVVSYAPVYFRMFTPPTLYDAPIRQAFGFSWEPSLPGRVVSYPTLATYDDEERSVLEESNRMLMQTYVNRPWLIRSTEDEMELAGGGAVDRQ